MPRTTPRPHLYFFTFATLLLFTATLQASTTFTGGNIASQTWDTNGSPYIIQGDLTVPSGTTLTIQPGTVVQFASTDTQSSGTDTARVELIVNGILNASGTSNSPVIFQPQTGTGPNIWYGIEINSGAASAIISNAVIENAVTGLTSTAPDTTLQLSDSTFTMNQAGILISAGSPVIQRLQLFSNQQYGIEVYAGTAVALENSLLYSNNTAVAILGNTSQDPFTTTVDNCTIHQNPTGILAIDLNRPFVPPVLVRNSLFTQNNTAISTVGSGVLAAQYNDFWGNGVDGAQASGNLFSDPQYVDASTLNLRLSSNSPCIDAGFNNPVVGFATDLDNNPRFTDDVDIPDTGTGTAPIVDIGAYEFQPSAGVTIVQQPQSQTINAGDTLALSVVSKANGPTYQWSHGTNIILGATAATYTVTTNAVAADAGSYTCA